MKPRLALNSICVTEADLELLILQPLPSAEITGPKYIQPGASVFLDLIPFRKSGRDVGRVLSLFLEECFEGGKWCF